MQPVSTGQNVRLTGYISYQGTDGMIGDLKESASVKQSGLSERFTEIRNSAAEFFTAVKGKINNVFEPLGNRINKIAIREEKTQSDSAQTVQGPAETARMVLDIAQRNVQKKVDDVKAFLGENQPLNTDSLQKFSKDILRTLVTLLSGVDKAKGLGMDKATNVLIERLIKNVNSALSGAAGCGPNPDEKIDQLGSICDSDKATNYLNTANFDQNLRSSIMKLVKVIEGPIMTDLMDLNPAEIINREKPQTENNVWRRLPDN